MRLGAVALLLGLAATAGVADPGAAGTVSQAVTPEAAHDAARAQTRFMLHCQGCHLPGGEGIPGVVPRLNAYVGNFLRVPGGREYLVRVPGSANSTLDDEALAQLLNWLLVSMSREQLPAAWHPYTGAEIARLRALPPLENLPDERARLVSLIDAG